MTGPVLDASALLAWLHGEPGGPRVEAALDGALVSAVNWCEVLRKALAHGIDVEGLTADLTAVGVRIVAFDPRQAELAAGLLHRHGSAGLSMADGACLALARLRAAPALTADRLWARLDTGVEVVLIR